MVPTADDRPWVLVLTGPTGSGKSHAALQLAAQLPVEIVSIDSAQVFRGMDIGTAKPTQAERSLVAHHLIDIRDPVERYSAGEFVRDAAAAIAAIHERGRVPLLVGGTMLYLRSLLQGMAPLPPASPPLRAELERRAAHAGWATLHRELMAIDPEAAARIHPHDPQRIQRALEVHALTGRPISAWQRTTRGAEQDYRWLKFALIPKDRQQYQLALSERWHGMLTAGFPAEVQLLYSRGDLSADFPAMRAVGYRQLWRWCSGEQTLQQAADEALIATRQLAKRQLTWLRSERGLTILDSQGVAVARQVADIVSKSTELL
jgi:tRNA dimethylallyltransferase